MNHHPPQAGPTPLNPIEEAFFRRLMAAPDLDRTPRAALGTRLRAVAVPAGKVVGGAVLISAAATLPGVVGRMLQLGALSMVAMWGTRLVDRVSRSRSTRPPSAQSATRTRNRPRTQAHSPRAQQPGREDYR